MTAPAYLSGSFRYKYLTAVLDVSTIITNLVSELVANGWTDTGGAGTGPCTSPTETADGSYMTVTLTRISATRIRYTCKDHFGRQINYYSDTTLVSMQDIDATGTNVAIYSGPDYFFVDSERATRECFALVRANQEPYAIHTQARTSFLASCGPRNYTGALANQQWQNWYVKHTEDTSAYITTGQVVNFRPYSEQIRHTHVSGVYICRPVHFLTTSNRLATGGGTWYGRCPQALLVPELLAFGATFTAAIDDAGNTGVFKVVGFSAVDNGKLAVRIS